MATTGAYNTKSIRIVIVAILLLLYDHRLSAQEYVESTINGNTVAYKYTPVATTHTSALDEYLAPSLGNRNVRFNIVGGPGYSANTGWRLTAIGNLYYRHKGSESATPGTLSLSATASLTGYYNVAIVGRNHFGSGKHRISYGANLDSEPTYIWGLDYQTSHNGSAGTYTSREYAAGVDYRYFFAHRFFIDIAVDYHNIAAIKLDDRASQITLGKSKRASAFGIALGLGVDTRRSSEHVTRGIYAMAKISSQPRFTNTTGSTLYELNVIFDYFQPLWRGCTLALDLYGEFHNAATPWFMRAQLGGDSRMRGYYYGRYNGDNLLSAQLELRQHIWEGLGVAVWGGAGETFSATDTFAWHKVLPTYGCGLRWAFNTVSAIRLDMAFGRNSRYFILGFNEAF